MNEGKSARVLRVGWDLYRAKWSSQAQAVGSVRWGVCGVAWLAHSAHYGPRHAPCIRSLPLPTRLTQITQTGSQGSWVASQLIELRFGPPAAQCFDERYAGL
jgi:hypothetical protein